MKLHQNVIKLRHTLFAGLFLFLTQLGLSAQSTGRVSGRVSDAETGRSLQGAVVRIANSSIVEYTDLEGAFNLSGVPTGTVKLNVEYVGLDNFTTKVDVIAGQTSIVRVEMKSTVFDLQELKVTSTVIGQARAINQQKTAEGIVNIVSEEAFGAMVDGNVGAALQRLPGISVNEDQDGSQGSINIRGIAGDFNSVQVDGNRVPTSGVSNSFNPRNMAADGVTNIEVVKAPTPDRDGDAIGGIVNLVTRSAFEREGQEMKLNLAATLNDMSDNWGHKASFSYSDLFDLGDGENNFGVSFTLSSYNTDRYSINADQDWVQVTPENNPELNLNYDEPVWFMESTHFEHDTRETDTYTINASFDYRIDEHNSVYFRPMVSHFERNGVSYETDQDIDTRFQDKVGGRKTYAELTPTYGLATEDSEGSRGWIGTLDDRSNDTYSLNFGGRHEQESSLLTWDVFYSDSDTSIDADNELNMLMEPDDPWIIQEYHIVDPDGYVEINVVNGVDITDLSLMSEGELEMVDADKSDEVLSGRLDWEKSFNGENGVFTFKTGAKWRRSQQEFDQNVDLYEMDEDFPYASVLEATDAVILLKPKYYNVIPSNGIALLDSNPELFEFVEDDSLEDSNVEDYMADETITAGYLMGTYQTGIHTIIAGFRYEQIDWDINNKIASYLNDDMSISPVNSSKSYSFWLPGIHFRHELNPNLILRESYNRSYGRPKLDELSMGRWVDDDGNIEEGNPDLKPAVSDNFDIQLEYYTDQGSLFSVGFFYKDIADFSYEQEYTFDELDSSGNPILVDDGELEYTTFLNGAGATNYGIELIARQRLHFLPGALAGFSVAASATFTESEAEYPARDDNRDLPLEGFSDTILTLALDYDWKNFSARLDYHYRSDYIEGLGDDIESDEFYAAEYRVDYQMAYRLMENLELYMNVSNLTEEPQISYQGYSQFVEDASYSGRKFTFGAEYSF